MMLAPLKPNTARVATSKVKWIPAPVRGWNAKDDLTEMSAEDAIVLDNMVVTERGCRTRDGFTSHVTGITGTIQSLMDYAHPDGTRKLFAANSANIYDVTTAGAVGSAAVSSLSSGVWSHVNFRAAGTSYLVIANGANSVRTYDGSTWATPSITGATSANLIHVNIHAERLWFVEKNTLRAWYLPTSAVSGAATSIDFGPFSRLGGELIAMTSWSRDGGAGIDDVAVWVTSRGELHVYSGTDPSDATKWERVGTFRIPEPISRRCFVKAGADVGILTSQGLVPLSNVLSIASTEVQRVAATEMIGSAFQLVYEAGKTMRGWQVIEYPKKALVVVNIPLTEGTTYHQYVLSVNKKAWSRFTGIDCECWGLMGDRMFFGGVDGNVYEFTGDNDAGAEINAVIVQAFQDMGEPGNKVALRMRPQVIAPSGYRPSVGLRFDYSDTTSLFEASPFTASGPEWDVTDWDAAFWAAGLTPPSEWQSVRGRGFVMAPVIQISLDEAVTYNGMRLMFDPQGAI